MESSRNSKLYNILNLYSFVKTDLERSHPEFVKQRVWEFELMKKQRTAVKFCKDSLSIKTNEFPKLSNEDKQNIENCLTENFLKEDPNFFGKRDVIFLDLHDYTI